MLTALASRGQGRMAADPGDSALTGSGIPGRT